MLLCRSFRTIRPNLLNSSIRYNRHDQRFLSFWGSNPAKSVNPPPDYSEIAHSIKPIDTSSSKSGHSLADAIVPNKTPVPELEVIPESFKAGHSDSITDNVQILSHQIGDLADMGLCNKTPAGFFQYMMECTHVLTGLPWWATIVFSGIALRLILMPSFVKNQRITAIIARIGPELKEHQTKYREYSKLGMKTEGRTELMAIQNLFKSNGVSALSSLKFPILSSFCYISLYIGLQAMCKLPVPGFTTGGFGPFLDLTARDPYYLLLPIINAYLIQKNLAIGSDGISTQQNKPIFRIIKAVTWLLPILTMNFQSAIFFYWIPAQIFQLIQTKFVRHPNFRTKFKLPPLPVEACKKPAVPFQFKRAYFEAKFKNFKNPITEVQSSLKEILQTARDTQEIKQKEYMELEKKKANMKLQLNERVRVENQLLKDYRKITKSTK